MTEDIQIYLVGSDPPHFMIVGSISGTIGSFPLAVGDHIEIHGKYVKTVSTYIRKPSKSVAEAIGQFYENIDPRKAKRLGKSIIRELEKNKEINPSISPPEPSSPESPPTPES